jgi:hypothetical protein
VTKEQEALFRRMPLGGEGLLAPIFRHGVSVRVPDVLVLLSQPERVQTPEVGEATTPRDAASQVAFHYAHGQLAKEGLRSMGVPRGHPLVCSFLGAPHNLVTFPDWSYSISVILKRNQVNSPEAGCHVTSLFVGMRIPSTS